MSDLPAITGVNLTRTNPNIIVELAMGMEPPLALLARYGYNPEQAGTLLSNELIQRQIESKRAELKSQGIVFKTKALMAAEDILEDVYVEAKMQETPLPQKLDALKFFAKAAGVDQVQSASGAAGGGFNITINLGDKSVTLTEEKVVNAE